MTTASTRRSRLVVLDRAVRMTRFLGGRFGTDITLGELHAAVIAHGFLIRREPLSVSLLAELSGQHKQSISRWLKLVPFVTLRENPNDSRSKLIWAKDEEALEAMTEYLSEMLTVPTKVELQVTCEGCPVHELMQAQEQEQGVVAG